MKNLLLVLTIIVGTLNATAGQPVKKTDLVKTEISGQVIDITNNEVLTGVMVQVEGQTEKQYTDFDGRFELEIVGDNNPTIYFSYISYNDEIVDIKLPYQASDLKVALKGK